MTLHFLSEKERISLDLEDMFSKFGFSRYKVNRFEEYAFYMEKEHFLTDKRLLTFTDTHGKLMALKPDVTMSIVKNSLKSPQVNHKIYYNESVFRIPQGEDDFKEIHQLGVEYIGKSNSYQTLEILNLACKSLEKISDTYRLCLSNTALLLALLEETGVTSGQKENIIQYLSQKNSHDLEKYLKTEQIAHADSFLSLLLVPTTLSAGLPALRKLFPGALYAQVLAEFEETLVYLMEFVDKDKVYLDFSHIPSTEYYQGLVFSGYIQGLALPVLSGGRYDNLIQKMGSSGQSALGFGVDLSAVDKLFPQKPKDLLNICPNEGDTAVSLLQQANALYQEGKSFLIST